MPAGQPMKFKSVKEMEAAISAYFSKCDSEKRPYTMSGLAYSLGVSRQTLLNYRKNKGYEKFFDTVKKAKARVAIYVEEKLMSGHATAGAIFNLKNNFDWKDKQEIDDRHSGEIVFKWQK